jgi:hypothetical protein
MNEPSAMATRTPIERITYISAEGNPHVFQVGALGRNCSEIREVQENGEFCLIPWLEVWEGDRLIARFSQHKVEHILYQRQP